MRFKNVKQGFAVLASAVVLTTTGAGVGQADEELSPPTGTEADGYTFNPADAPEMLPVLNALGVTVGYVDKDYIYATEVPASDFEESLQQAGVAADDAMTLAGVGYSGDDPGVSGPQESFPVVSSEGNLVGHLVADVGFVPLDEQGVTGDED